MAISNAEQNKIKELKAQGYSLQEIQGYIAGKRLGRTSTVQQREVEDFRASQSNLLTDIASDIPEDIQTAFTGAKGSVQRGIQTAQDVRGRVESGETSPVAGTLQTIGAGLRAGAEVVGEGVLVAGKSVLPEKAEKAIASVVGQGAEAIVTSRPAQEVQDIYDNLSEEQKRNVQGILGTAEGLGTAFGFGPVVSKLRGSLSRTAIKALEESDDILRSVRQVPRIVDIPEPDVATIKRNINKIRANISDLDPQVETVLKNSDFAEVNHHFQLARNASGSPYINTPLDKVVATNGNRAFDAIDQARRKAIEGKKNILSRVANESVPGNTINEVMASGIQKMKSNFGADIKPNGVVSQVRGRVMKLDTPDRKLIQDYFSRLNSLGVSPTVQQVDDFVDWAQGELYKQSKTLSKKEVASEPLTRALQGMTGDLNTRLKDVVGGGYGDVNLRISKLIEMQDELSRALGADDRKGVGFLKRLFSPAGDQTRNLLNEVAKETGIDLIHDTTLARYAMDSVGDARQKSLLRQIDNLAEEASSFSPLNPASWYRAIREKLDLDGQDLANEIIRRQTD